MSVRTRPAGSADLPFLRGVDNHVAEDVLDDCVSQGRVLVIEHEGTVVGFLRWGLFWDQVPFMNLLWVLPDRRGRGLGSALVAAWEESQAAAGHDLVLTSTLSNESAQHLYRRLGYLDAGDLLMPGEAPELILRKPLAPPAEEWPRASFS